MSSGTRTAPAAVLHRGRIRHRAHGKTHYASAAVMSFRADRISVATDAQLRRGDIIQLIIDMGGQDVVVLGEIVIAGSLHQHRLPRVSVRVLGCVESKEAPHWWY
jgi:hypothetical protein